MHMDYRTAQPGIHWSDYNRRVAREVNRALHRHVTVRYNALRTHQGRHVQALFPAHSHVEDIGNNNMLVQFNVNFGLIN